MLRCFIICAVLTLMVFLTACSSYADFVLVNESQGPITVKYSVQHTDKIPFILVKNRLASREQHWKNPREFNEFPPDRLAVSSDGLSTTAILLPGEVLFLTWINQWDIHEEPVLKSGINRLAVFGPSGSVEFKGDQVFAQFVPSEYGWFPSEPGLYTYTYR